MKNNNSIITTNAALATVPQANINNVSTSLEDRRDASIEKLNSLYSDFVKQSAVLMHSMIGVGECVVEILGTFPPSSEKVSSSKQQWKLLEIGGQVPFGWVQALRYKKIYEQRDALQQKFQDLGINPTVEKAYRLLGGADEKAESPKPPPAPSFDGTSFGVNSQSLVQRRNELARDISTQKAELHQLTEKLEHLEKMDAAYTYVHSFLAKPNAMVRPPTLTTNIAVPFSLVAKENKEVDGYFKLLQASFQCKDGTRFSKQDRKYYRAWLFSTFDSDQSKLLKKLQAFIHNPETAMNSDSDFANHLAQKRKDDEAAKAEERAYREAERAAMEKARKEFQMAFHRVPAAV